MAAAMVVITIGASIVHAQTITLEEQSEGSFLAEKVSMLASEYHEVARVNRTRHKVLCFKLGALTEKARGVAAYVQQSAFTNTMTLQTTRVQEEVTKKTNDSKARFGLDASVTNAGQAINTAADQIQTFCEGTGLDWRETLMPYLMNLKSAADVVAEKI